MCEDIKDKDIKIFIIYMYMYIKIGWKYFVFLYIYVCYVNYFWMVYKSNLFLWRYVIG